MMFYKDDTTYSETSGHWIDVNSQQYIQTFGQRGFGKSVLDEFVANELYDNGFTILDLYAADNLENLFWCVNLEHKKKHRDWIETHPDQKEPLECECDTAYPILVLCPEYVYWDEKSLEFANGMFYTEEQWLQKSRDSGQVLPVYDRSDPPKKPSNLQKEPLIKIHRIPQPVLAKTNPNTDVVRSFTDAILLARKERRILVMNPKFWARESYMFKTLEIILRSISDITEKYFQPLTKQHLGKPKSEWTVQELSWHRTAIIMREVGEIMPQGTKSDASGDSLLSKKALLNLIRKSRHTKTTCVFDAQREMDLFPNVRDEVNITILKHSSRKLLGDGLAKYEDIIDEQRKKILEKYSYSNKGLRIANRKFPRIGELNFNYAYVIYSNDFMRLWRIPMPRFHHKMPTDNWCNITGVSYKFDESAIKITDKKASSSAMKPNESDEKILYHTVRELRTPEKGKGLKWDDVLIALAERQESGVIRYPKPFRGMSNDAIRQKWTGLRRKHGSKSEDDM